MKLFVEENKKVRRRSLMPLMMKIYLWVGVAGGIGSCCTTFSINGNMKQ